MAAFYCDCTPEYQKYLDENSEMMHQNMIACCTPGAVKLSYASYGGSSYRNTSIAYTPPKIDFTGSTEHFEVTNDEESFKDTLVDDDSFEWDKLEDDETFEWDKDESYYRIIRDVASSPPIEDAEELPPSYESVLNFWSGIQTGPDKFYDEDGEEIDFSF